MQETERKMLEARGWETFIDGDHSFIGWHQKAGPLKDFDIFMTDQDALQVQRYADKARAEEREAIASGMEDNAFWHALMAKCGKKVQDNELLIRCFKEAAMAIRARGEGESRVQMG